MRGRNFMGALRFLALGCAVCIALMNDVARADELALPYTCSMDKGAPHLAPSLETETYRIIGAREDQPFTACTSSAAWTCQTMMVHRFTVECGGQRVPWARVAASARALGVELPDRLPPGFAPISRLKGRLILPGFGKKVSLPRVTAESLSRDAVIEPAAARPETSVVKKANWTTVVDPVDVPVGVPDNSGSALKVAGVISTLLASLLAACLLLVRRRQFPAFEFSAGAASAGSAISRIREFGAALVSAFRRNIVSWRETAPETGGGEDFSSVLMSLRERLHDTEYAVSMLPSDLLLRDVLISELDGLHHRVSDLGHRSGKLGAERTKVAIRGLIRDLDRIGRIAEGLKPTSEDMHARVGESDVPGTVFEAYRILGLNPDAPDAAVKKIVDALRMAWHPDHARDEADRRYREQRIKQVNAAWDLLKAKLAAAA